MNFWKISALSIFSALTLLCVSFAHSNQVELNDTGYWKASWWTGGCSLKVEKDASNDYIFIASDQSRLRFDGFWPTEPGEILLESPSMREDRADVGGEYEPANTLRVRFSLVQGKIQPVGYTLRQRQVWDNKFVYPEFSCPGLKKQR